MDAWQAAERARAGGGVVAVRRACRLTISAGVCELGQAGDADGAAAAGRRRALLGEGPRPQPLRPLLARGGRGALRRASAPRASSATRRSPRPARAGPRGGRQGPVHPAPLRARRRAGRAARDRARAGRADRVRAAARGRRWCTTSARSASPTPCSPSRAGSPTRSTRVMREHAALGGRDRRPSVLTPEQVAWVRGHHERFDGARLPGRPRRRRHPRGRAASCRSPTPGTR